MFATYFSQLFESMPDAIVMVDAKGQIVLANTQAATMFGYRKESLLGHHVEMLLPTRLRKTHVGHREHYSSNPHTRPMGAGLELRGCRSDGSEFPVEISLSPLETNEGSFVVSAIRDITDRQQLEESRRSELERESRRMEEANRMKSEFLAGMSHELRTPLNGIIGFSEFLLDGRPGPLNGKQREYLEDVLSSARHLLQLINNVLDLAKVESGKADVVVEEFSLKKTVREVSAVLRPSMNKKTLLYEAVFDDGIDSVRLDQHKVKQILYNLLSNAVKFTDEGGTVTLRVSPADDALMSVSVMDTGIGIREADLSKLFVEFQQLDSGPDRQFQGTGLGLSLTKRLVELMGGRISVESIHGRGSTFTVLLPRQLD